MHGVSQPGESVAGTHVRPGVRAPPEDPTAGVMAPAAATMSRFADERPRILSDDSIAEKIKVPDITHPTLCWKQAEDMRRCDFPKGHSGPCVWHPARPIG